MADTRKDKRAPVSLKVRFKSATVDEFIEHYSKDVSRGGIFIKSSQPMGVGTLLKFQFQLKNESALIKGVGRVVWTRAEQDATADQPAGMGIKFIKMDPDSKAMVERIVDANDAPGAFEVGRKTATHAESPSDHPPPAEAEATFFPKTAPAVLPPPEDRTAVRHAAQFLAEALREAGTDEAAAREAAQKAEEAQRRTAQIEAERAADEERRKQAQAGLEPSNPELPSMIIDPTLGGAGGGEAEDRPTDANLAAKPAPSSERPTGQAAKPKPSAPLPTPVAASYGDRSAERDEPPSDHTPVAAPLPMAPAERPRKRSPWPMVAVIAAVAAGAFFALRTHDQRPAADVPPTAVIGPAPEDAPHGEAPAPSAAEPAPAAPDLAANAPAPQEPAAQPPEPAPEPVIEPAPQPPAVPAKLVKVPVSTTPAGADVIIAGEVRGKSPVTLELAEGLAQTVIVRLPGRKDATVEVTPSGTTYPVKLTLEWLPYVVHVESVPPGASVALLGHRATTPADVELGAPPKGPFSVTTSLPGYQSHVQRVTLPEFAPAGETMRVSVSATLATAPAPAPKPAPAPSKPKPAPMQPAPGADTEQAPSSAPAAKPSEPAPKPEVTPPEPAPPKAEPIPDNPFG